MYNANFAERYSQPSVPLLVWKAALYIRLSREDGDKAESYSVSSQREILKEYLKQHPDIELYDIYIDDGYSGTNFNRPGFNRMMEAVYNGNVNCVIVKDLSRFGRNYTDAGNYLDNIFVRYRVRFIALNNGLDTASGNMNAAMQCISVGVTNVINESLAATTSVNVRGTLNVNRQQGKFIGSFPTYGYLKDPQDRHKLIVDEETAPIVKMIFEKFVAGESIIGITKDLNEMGVPNPSMYKKLKGLNYKHPSCRSNDGLWPDSSVRRILQNQMYIGNMVQGKNTTMSYKIKQCRSVPKEDWIIVEGTHDPIIDRETFDNAQALFNKHIRKSPNKKEVDLFSGFVRCSDCKRAMNKKTNTHSYGTYHYYRCVTARKMRKSACSNHTIRVDRLEQAVLVTIQKMIDTSVSMSKILDKINSDEKRCKESNHLQKTLKVHTNERSKIAEMIADLYPDWKSGVITQDEYLALKEKLNGKLNVLDEKIAALNKSAEELTKGITDENDFLAHFKKYGNIEKLTRPLLIELVDEILVHEGGDIEVVFKFRDSYAKAVEYIEMNKNNAYEKKTKKKEKSA